MEICVCTLKGYDRNQMIQAIEMVKKRLGGSGLLKVSEVRGYGGKKLPADLVFRFKGMNFPMGIRINDGQVEFIGDAWKSRNWEQVKDEIVAAYKELGVASYFNLNQFSLAETKNDNQGILLEGFR